MLAPLDEGILRQLFDALHRERVEYVLVGGLALLLHGLGRTTEDIDLFVSPGEENTARVRAALTAVFHDPEIAGITAQDLSGEYGVVRYGPPAHDFLIDLLVRIGEMFRYADLEWEVKDFDGVPVRVATPRTLYLMKRGTARELDRADAAQLKRKFSLGES
ncbi:MAG: nucleotidyl transferase AbiEii/AbiGii toxin family protein [Thermoanaerobaculia bacterium]